MIKLYKRINDKLELVDYGIPRLKSEYKHQGFFIGNPVVDHNTEVVHTEYELPYKDSKTTIIHHIHRARFGLRERINGLICKLIPKRFLSY